MIIDCHQHVNWNGYDATKLDRLLGKFGVDAAWLLPWETIDGGLEPSYSHLSTEQAFAAAERFPRRFVPFCYVDPRRENAEKLLRAHARKGARGYGEHKIRLCFDNPDSVRMYRTAGDLGLPVLFHVDVPLPHSNMWYNYNIDSVERVLRSCPGTVFIGHGPGWWREISADADRAPEAYPAGPVKSGGKLPHLLESYNNIYADLSAGSGLNAISRDRAFGRRFVIDFAPKLLYGTDTQNDKLLRYLRRLRLPETVQTRILCDNARKLVPLGRTAGPSRQKRKTS